MRRILPLVFLVAITFVSCSPDAISNAVAPPVNMLGADQLNKFANSGVTFVFLDVRSAKEIEQDGTLSNYLHIPIDQLEQRLDEVPQRRRIVVGCDIGVRSERGARILMKHGYENVFAAGLSEYRTKGYPLIYPKLGG